MSQHDMTIADQAGAAFLGDLNSALAALFSNNSGATEPTTTVAYQFWADTTSGWLKQRNAANTGWEKRLPLAAARVDVASAATLDLDANAVTSDYLRITGTTTVNAVTLASGQRRFAVAGGAFQLTHGASLVLPGAAPYTTTVGDVLLFLGEAGGVVRVMIWKADGTAVVGASSVNTPPPVRQTVLSGPVDSSGLPVFGGSTGGTTVTASGTLKATAAYAADNRTGSITNPSWTGLSTSGTMYLYLDIAADGTCTSGSTTLKPTEQWGGTYSTTNGQNTFNIQEMTMKAGNGSTASQVWRVFVGEVTVSGGVVTAITWYALMGRYAGAWTNTLPSAGVTVSANHNIGSQEFDAAVEIKCLTAEYNYSVGDIVEQFTNWRAGTGHVGFNFRKRALTVSTTTADGAWQGQNATTTTSIAWTAANWAYRLVAKRRF